MNVFTRSPFALDSMWDDPTFVQGYKDWYDETLTPQPNELGEETGNTLGSGVEKSHETRWQNGKDIPEGKNLTAYTSGSELRPRQSCGGSVPPTQSFSERLEATGDSLPDQESFSQWLQQRGDSI